MELIQKNIHMDRRKVAAVNQVALEDDVNIPEHKPDVNAVCLEKGKVILDEIRPMQDMVSVKGSFSYCILYHTTESGAALVCLEGKLPFEEKIHLTGVGPGDSITVEGTVEDFTVGMINSRKLSLQALILLEGSACELYDEALPVGIRSDREQDTSEPEYRMMPLEVCQLAVCKNDIFRIKEEFLLPAGYPNAANILWSLVQPEELEFRTLDEKLLVEGDFNLFLLYEGEGEEHPIRTYEARFSVSDTLECHGCKERMLSDIRASISQLELSIRPDGDGEERNFQLDTVLDLKIRLYEEEEISVLSDIYCTDSELETGTKDMELPRLLGHFEGKYKLTDKMQVKEGNILQLLHSEGIAALDTALLSPDGVTVKGTLRVNVLYITGMDANPYGAAQTVLPYEYTLEIPGLTGEIPPISVCLEKLQVNMLGSEEIEVKAVLSFATTAFQNTASTLITSIEEKTLDVEKKKQLPGMAIYVVKEGDNLWNIGKKYYVGVDSLRKLNELTSDDLKKGQMLLVVKG